MSLAAFNEIFHRATDAKNSYNEYDVEILDCSSSSSMTKLGAGAIAAALKIAEAYHLVSGDFANLPTHRIIAATALGIGAYCAVDGALRIKRL
jgi:hypothetical protein